jgi:hypothetical protein
MEEEKGVAFTPTKIPANLFVTILTIAEAFNIMGYKCPNYGFRAIELFRLYAP